MLHGCQRALDKMNRLILFCNGRSVFSCRAYFFPSRHCRIVLFSGSSLLMDASSTSIRYGGPWPARTADPYHVKVVLKKNQLVKEKIKKEFYV